MEDLKKIEHLALVQKVSAELRNHTGIEDITLAEFVIDMASNKTQKDFAKELSQLDKTLTQQFLERLHNVIMTMHPDKKKLKNIKTPRDELSQAGVKFPALAIKDSRNEAKKLDTDLLSEAQKITESVNGNEDKFLKSKDSQSQRYSDKYSVKGSSHKDKSSKKDKHKHKNKDRHRDRDRDRDRDSDYEYERHKKRSKHRDRSRSRSNSPSPNKHKKHKSDKNGRHEKEVARTDKIKEFEQEKTLELYQVYEGKVTSVMDHGCFVELSGFKRRVEGLVHLQNLTAQRISNAREIVQRGQSVYVKVVSTSGEKLLLSIRDVDQSTGKDLIPLSKQGIEKLKNMQTNLMSGSNNRVNDTDGGLKGLSGIRVKDRPSDGGGGQGRKIKQKTDQEIWETKQLMAAGVMPATELPDFDEENGYEFQPDNDQDEEFEIDINDEEAPFLAGQSMKSGEMSPIKIVKNLEGSLQRAAMMQSARSKERREMREQQQRTLMEAIPKELSRPWEDPMPEDGERHLAQELRGIGLQQYQVPEWKTQAFGKAPTFGLKDNRPITEQRKNLPIFKFREQLIYAFQDQQVLIVIGETGSGKTTQMPQYLYEAGFTKNGGKIACTQPRRVAAMSVAKRVADEFGCRLGEEVGYSIRFEDCTSPSTIIKFMTDGMLLRECLLDELLNNYSVVILDEAHERTIHTDVLFGLCKEVVKKRKDFRLIVTSATLDAGKFSDYFFEASIFRIPGRYYEVEVNYSKQPEEDYLDAAIMVSIQIHIREPEGDILVFLTGQEEIDYACQQLYEKISALGDRVPKLIVLPVYSALPSEVQTKIFEPAPPGARKCIVATNIAEASLTIDGIYYVVDPGFAKYKVYNPKNGMDSLVVAPISKASADQRKGRAGRTGPGKCYRLYTEAAYLNEMLPSTVPEIQRTNLALIILTLKAMGINDLLNFDFMDPPPTATMISALEQLYNLGALDDEGMLTKLGRKMAEFPMDPPMSKVLIASVDLGCSDEILTVLAMLQAQNIFYRPREKAAQADQKRARFFQPEGDHLTLLTVYEQWKASKFSSPWCHDNFIQARSLRRAQDVRKQLMAIMERYNLQLTSAGRNTTLISKAITSGFFFHAARKDPQEGYKTIVEQQTVYIHPSSALFQYQPDWVLYHELVLTSKEYMREVLALDPRWLVELAPRFFKGADPNKLSRRKRAEKLEPLFDRYHDPNAWRLSRRRG